MKNTIEHELYLRRWRELTVSSKLCQAPTDLVVTPFSCRYYFSSYTLAAPTKGQGDNRF